MKISSVAIVVALLFSIAPAVAQPPCQRVVPSIPASCSGTVVSAKFFHVTASPTTLPTQPYYAPTGFPIDPLFNKKFDGTFLVCNLVFDIYGEKVFTGNGTMRTGIGLDGMPTTLVAMPAPPVGDVYAATVRLYAQNLAGPHRIEVFGQVTRAQTGTWATNLMLMDCHEIWMTVQP